MNIFRSIFLCVLGMTSCKQPEYFSNGARFSVPDGFQFAETRGSEFAAFHRDNVLKIAFAKGCNDVTEKYSSNLDRTTTADLCFATQFLKLKSAYGPTTWIRDPADTVVHGANCKWAELHASIGDQGYFLVYSLVKGKKYNYEIMLSGHQNSKEEGLAALREIMASYKEI